MPYCCWLVRFLFPFKEITYRSLAYYILSIKVMNYLFCFKTVPDTSDITNLSLP